MTDRRALSTETQLLSTADQPSMGPSKYTLISREYELHKYGSQREEQEVTNDSTDVVNASSEFVDRGFYPLQYSCQRLASTTQLQTTEVYYDYEYTAYRSDDQTDPLSWPESSSLDAVEWGLAWLVADDFGLHGCHFDSQKWNDAPGAEGSTVIIVSSLPGDEPNPDSAECVYLQPFQPTEVCYAMRGSMTIKYTGNNREAVEDQALNFIKHELQAQTALTGTVTQTRFVSRVLPPDYPGPVPAGADKEIQSSTAPGVAVGAVIGAAVVVLAGVLLLRRRRRKNSVREGKSVVIEEVTDEERGAADEFPTLSATPDSPGRSISAKSLASSATLLISNKSPQTTLETLPAEDELTVNSTASDAASDAAIVVPVVTPTKAAGEKSPQRVVDVLPPLPPNKSSSKPPPSAAAPAQSIKRRRKKKKKKKKNQALQRVNSRDSVKGMETIAESSEEINDDDDDDDGSEYSWSTDDSECSRSREPSPDPSGRSSRDPSPDPSSRSGSESTPEASSPDRNLIV